MKSKNTKIQILKKGMAIILASMFVITPMAPVVQATTSLDDNSYPSIAGNTATGGSSTSGANSGNNNSGSSSAGNNSAGNSGGSSSMNVAGQELSKIKDKIQRGETLINVNNEVQLRALAELVNNGDNDCKGLTIKLLNNIEINKDVEWEPIGTLEKPFLGTFDGNNKKISNLNYTKGEKNSSYLNNIGLFGVIGNEGKVQNLIIDNFNINVIYSDSDLSNTDYTTYHNAGNIAGINKGTIENCKNTSPIQGASYVGGIAGKNEGTIKNCINTGSVKGYAVVGGITGSNNNRIENCKNTGSVTADSSRAGGIAGISQKDNPNDKNVIQQSINAGTISAGKELAGGIVGENSLKVVNCTNEGTVSGKDLIGGITGKNKSTVEKSKNAGSIAATGENIGGIIGNNEGTIQGSLNTANVTGKNNIGGIAGINNSNITNCTNKGTITAETTVAGIVGLSNAGTISKVKNEGSINGKQNVAGIAGGVISGNIEFSHNVGAINAENENNEGGIVASVPESGSLTLNYSIQEGDVGVFSGTNNDLFDGIIDTPNNSTVTGCIYISSSVGFGPGGINQCDPVESKEDMNTKVSETYICEKTIDDNLWDSSINGAGNIRTIRSNGIDVYTRDSGKKVVFNSALGITIGCAVEDLGCTATINDIIETAPEKVEEEKPEEIKNGIKSIFSQKVSEGEGEVSNTTVTYVINKDGKVITDAGDLKNGDVITVTATFNKVLKDGQDENGKVITIQKAPTLEIGSTDNFKKMTATKVESNDADKTTTITYTYTIEEDVTTINGLRLSGCENIYAVGEDIAKGTNTIISTQIPENITIKIDNVKPVVNAKIYVENKLETARYTAGKVVLFEVTTSEPIQEIGTKIPTLQVSFSKSGTGKYNYDVDTKKAGCAKYRNEYTTINEDGTTTWVFSYEIQEGDEGELEFTYIDGKLVDLAGNVNDFSKENTYVSDVTGKDWNCEDLNISYKLYKNDKEINENTHFTKEDKLKVELEFDKVLYDSIGNANKTDLNSKLNKENAPSLYLNGITNFKANASSVESIVNEEKEEKTKITYNYDFSKILLEEVLTIEKLSLKNDMNESVSVTADVSANGVTPYAKEFYDDYSEAKDANGKLIQNYGIIAKDALKEIILGYNLVVDPNQNGTEFIGGAIYADTTAPTVEITASVPDRANNNQITYTFEFSEEVVGFEERDIIVNGGTKVENSFKEEIKGLKYTIIVRPIISDSTETTLQVIVKKGACLDLVAKELVEEEKVITLDNVSPVYVDYNVITEKNDSGKITSIIIEAIFNEDLADISKDSLDAEIKFGGALGKGTKVETVEGNKVKYVYTTSAADGGICTISLKGYVTDLSGNNSEEKEININNDITLTQTVIKDAENENITYSFKKNDEEIRDFSNTIYFVKGDKITVVKTETTPATSKEMGPAIKATEYTYTVKEDINLIHMKYVKLIEATEESEATAVFAAEAGEGYIDISKANIYFDTIAPTIDISYDVDIKNENDRYTVGKELIINVTTSEEIQQLDKIPELNVSFSESGLGKYNYQKDTTKGNAIYVETKNEKGINTLTYKYVIENGDEGRPIIEFVNNETIKDLAGNTTNLGTKVVESDIELEDTWPTSEDGLNMSYNLYKNSVSEENKITEKTYFTKSDKLIVEINYDKVLYARVGSINTVNATSRLTDKYAPSLYLNGNEELTNDTIESTSVLAEYDEQSGKTVVTYTYNFEGISEETIALEKLVLKNDKNTITQSNGYFKDGQIIYADKWYPSYSEEHKDLYKFIDKDAIKVINLEDSLVVDPNASEESKIYADTTAPLVNITANVSDPTNADEVEYTFEFSEVVKDFTIEKIKVNGGDLVGELTEVVKGLKYTLKVRPSTATGNKGTLQVIVEKGACKDLVAIENVRQEKNITIDKIKPVFESYTIREENNQIIIEAIYNETITEATIPSLIIGDTTAKGKWEEIEYNDNKVTYVYNTDAADGGKVYAMLIGTAKDLAGNYSDELTQFIESDIVLERTVVKPSDENVYYTFEKNDKTIQDFSKPTYFKAKDIITVTKYETVNVLDEQGNQVNNEDGTPKTQEVQTKYSYEVNDELSLTHMKYMNLEEPSKEENVGKVTFSTENGIDITSANIYFDTIAPKVELSINPVGEKNQDNIYTEGTELLITATTDEAVQSEEIPEINLSFSNSGAGKYIPNEELTKGNLEYIETIEVENGRKIWAYRYIVQPGDDGIAILEYAKEINVTDLAGNTTTLKGYPRATSGDVKLSDNEIAGAETKVSYELYKNGEQITDFTDNTYFANGDTIKVIAKFDKALYSSWGSSNEVVSKDTAPTLTIDDKKFEVLSVNNAETTTDISYIYTIDGDSEGLLEELSLSTNKSIYAQLKDEKGNISYKTISGTIGNVDISNCNLHIYNSTTSIAGNEITIDTLVPTVKIKANVQNPTNADKILYTFEFSEIVKDFTIEDITLNKGKVENSDKFVEKEDGKVYELEVVPDVAEGNVDDVQVIVEKDVCTDRANKGNLKAENVIRVDRKSPIFIGLEAYAPTNSNIKLNEEIDSVQENYGPGAVVTIVATFDENVTADAKLVLQFSESGTAKGTVTTVENVGNKITYTYEITEGDKGTLSIKAFTGKVVDVVGNETVVTRRIIEGDTIVAKTIAPQLKELKVVSPAEGKYKADTSIRIEAVYDEEIYILEDNREIKLLNTNIEVEAEDGTKSYVNNAPDLKLRFGNGEERQATVLGYGTKEDGSIDRTKVVYTYTISEDNGELEITSYTNKENAEVCDIAGNKAALNVNQTGNTIIADTIKPEVVNIEAEVEEPIVSNTGIYYKDGNEVKITVEFAEEVNPAVVKPEILVGFSENGEEPTSYNKCVYEASENLNSTTVEYTYTIQEGENAYLWVKVPEDQFKDIAGNTNVKYDATVIENIFADTIDPCLTTNTNSSSSLPTEWKIEYIETDGIATGIKATGLFNEEIFSMKNNAIVPIDEMPTVGLFLNGKLERTSKVYRHEVENGQTKIVYEEDITNIDTTGSISVNFIDGTVYDRAGNKMTIVLTDGDITSPIFKDLKVLTENGFYKEGEVIEIVARFEEKTRLTTVPTLVVRLGERTLTLHGEYDLENSENNDTIKVAKYSYEVEAGDNGALNIISLKGQASDGVRTSPEISKIYIDLTDNKVNDVNTNAYELLNSEEDPYANNSEEYENVIADTKDPFIAKVEAKVNGEVIASYTKDEGKDAILSTGRTNSNELEYVITFSEPIVANDLTKEEVLSNISLYNATITDLILEYNSITIKAVTLSEAVQSLIISENIVKDRAGNTNDFERFNLVSTDFTKPTIGFISEYNGGTYVIPTNIGKVEIRPNVKIDEEISKIEYKWNNDEYVEIENYSSASDIAVPTKAFTEAGTQALSIRAIDIAGNVSETSKTYEILNSYIEIATSTREYTNQDITATVTFGTGLTDNRKVTFKAEGSENIVELNAKGINKDGNTEYTIVENGTIYAEATDRVGNKVFTETTITNIDKVAPEVNIALNRADLVIGTGKDSATIKTDVELKDNNWVEDAKFAYLQEDININNMTSEQKAKISNELDYEAKITDAVSTKDKTPYYLYVIATDKAGNETIEKVGPFTVLDTNEREKEVEGIEGVLGAKETVPAEIEISKLIAFKQDGRFIEISYNNFTETEEYMDIIKEKEITLTEERDGYIDYEYYSYVEVNKPTVITVTGKDACGNEVTATFEVKPETIKGPEFEVVGNPEDWTNQDVKLEVVEEEPLSALTVNGTDILSKDAKVRSNIVITQNGEYKFVATDEYGNISEKVITVTKIDKDNPVITKVETSGKDITITAEDATSGVAEYAITNTTEVPVEWWNSNVIKVTNDGIFFVWVKDNAGNITIAEEVVVVDTTAPTITFNYTLITVEAGMPLEATIMTDEEAKISYSWDEENWVESEDFLTSVRVPAKEYKTTGVYSLYAKAVDKYGNESKVQVIEFTVVKPSEDIDVPEIIFEDLPTIQVDGVHYVKVAADMTIEDVSNKMNKEALYGVTPEYKGLTEDKDLKTGSEITLAGETKYIVVVNGDVNNDGKVTPIDVTYANSIRLNKVKVNTIQKLAADFDLDGIIKPIDITMINSYRLGKIKGI